MQATDYVEPQSVRSVVEDSFHYAFGRDRKDKRRQRRQRNGWRTDE